MAELQKKAIQFCNKKAKIYSDGVLPNLHELLVEKGLSKEEIRNLFKTFKKINLISHFNPVKSLVAIASDGRMKNLFEVNSSNGSTNKSARGGWEDNLFNNIYSNSYAHEKVKYGTLNLLGNKMGVPSCSGYGDSYMLFKNKIKKRVSFVYADSSNTDWHIATFRHFFHVIYYLDKKVLQELINISHGNTVNRSLNYTYVEAQIHGPVTLINDVEKIFIHHRHKDNPKIINPLQFIYENYYIDYEWI